MAKVASKKKHIPINISLFEEPGSPCMAKPLDVWRDALAAVDVAESRVVDHPDLQLFRGYAFPPPRLFCTPNDEYSLEMMLGWLVVRTSWMQTICQGRDTPLPNPHQWRNFLRDVARGLELIRPDTRKRAPSAAMTSQASPSTSRPLGRGAKSKEAAKDIFTIHVPSRRALQRIIWHDRTVWQRDSLDFPPLNRRLLVWDVQEHNFRLEFLTLDRCVLPDVWKSPVGAAIRHQKLDAMWPNNFILMDELPTDPSGLTAKDWKDRYRFIEAFRLIIMDWPGQIPEELSRFTCHQKVNGATAWDVSTLERIERLASKHYCQTFFDYFCRAPSVPHVLPTM
ncbi:hypothetical protein P691DRAFT_682204 [Macrolepiota fuliginosa MF-IS2]|uniref:Uncharacterized protein n=1 Tax=Macrolepiota fuliginosa MF-IS2 TaxID=1400762 RepID=A0A9P5X3B1_9AGAR|nr:hypothetical protein P691DRAFT_682204 [Macrolepiota fuliginosa MF-IS2]